MNKKVNTILFILGATLFNILTVIISFVVLMLLYYKFIMVLLPETIRSWSFALIFLASIVVSFVIYRYLLRFLLKKIEIEKYFDPLFARKYKKS